MRLSITVAMLDVCDDALMRCLLLVLLCALVVAVVRSRRSTELSARSDELVRRPLGARALDTHPLIFDEWVTEPSLITYVRQS